MTYSKILRRKWAAVLLLACLLLSAAGCGAMLNDASEEKATPSAAPSFSGSTANSSAPQAPQDFYGETDLGWEPAEAPDMPGAGNIELVSASLPSGVKMIYRAYLELESTEFDRTVSRLDQLVADFGGYYESSQLYNYSARRSAQYTIRVPAERYQDFCTQVGSLAQVNSQNHTAENVSEQYYDTQSRLETQRTKLARLQELLAKAEDMADIITIESAIADTEWNIEALTTTLRQYDALVDFSTVTISLEEVADLTPLESLEEGFGTRLIRAFRQGTRWFWEDVQSMVLSLAYSWVSWLLALAVILVIVAVLLRFRRKRKKAALRPVAPAAPPAPAGPKEDAGADPNDDTILK